MIVRLSLPLLLFACAPGEEPTDSSSDTGSSDTGETDTGDTDTSETDTGGEDTGDTDTEPAWEEGTHSCEDARYLPYAIRGWSVCIDQAVFSDASHGEAVLTLLSSDLRTVLSLLPEGPATFLQGVRVWVEHTSDWAGAVYHPSASWLSSNGYPTYWAESIQIANSENYLSWTAVQPAIVLHELSHAWHHQYLGYSDPDISNAYSEAMASGIYDSVPYAGGGNAQAYATTNVQEYFAELTEAWFWENDFYPFVREELLEFDPTGAAVIEASWDH